MVLPPHQVLQDLGEQQPETALVAFLSWDFCAQGRALLEINTHMHATLAALRQRQVLLLIMDLRQVTALVAFLHQEQQPDANIHMQPIQIVPQRQHRLLAIALVPQLGIALGVYLQLVLMVLASQLPEINTHMPAIQAALLPALVLRHFKALPHQMEQLGLTSK